MLVEEVVVDNDDDEESGGDDDEEEVEEEEDNKDDASKGGMDVLVICVRYCCNSWLESITMNASSMLTGTTHALTVASAA